MTKQKKTKRTSCPTSNKATKTKAITARKSPKRAKPDMAVRISTTVNISSAKPRKLHKTVKSPSKSAPTKSKSMPGSSIPGAGKKSKLYSVNIKNHTDKKGGHPHVIVDNIDDKHVSVGLSTKAKKGKNSPNYKLETSPLGDGKQSYMRRQGTVAPTKEYVSPRHGDMTSKDFSKAKEYGDKAKKKYLEKMDKKK